MTAAGGRVVLIGAHAVLRPRCRCQYERTGCSVGHVVMPATAVVDTVLAAACGVALEAEKLADHPLASEKPDLARVDQRQQANVERTFGVGAGLVGDAVVAKLFSWEFAAVAVACSSPSGSGSGRIV